MLDSDMGSIFGGVVMGMVKKKLIFFYVQVLDYDMGFIFGGVVMVKLGSILLQLFRNESPDVQNMVFFLKKKTKTWYQTSTVRELWLK